MSGDVEWGGKEEEQEEEFQKEVGEMDGAKWLTK